jgi:hypothetical protein
VRFASQCEKYDGTGAGRGNYTCDLARRHALREFACLAGHLDNIVDVGEKRIDMVFIPNAH